MKRRALLAGVAAGASAAVAGCAGSVLGDPVEETRERYFEVPDGVPVRVTTASGDIDVETYGGQEVSVDATVMAPSEERLESVTVEESDVEGVLAVDAKVRGDSSRVSVDLDVRVPEGTAMALVQSGNGDVTVRDVAGVEAAETLNGDVVVRDAGPVQSASTENGDVSADLPAPLPGDVAVRTKNGDASAALSPAADASLRATTENGDVEVSGLELADRQDDEREVQGVLGDGTHEVTVASVNGDVTVEAL
jgi:DUF4097 and DUF4098 domain-containing protein YvlB